MIKLVLVRHGQSIWNLENRFTGWTDVSLSKQGIEEAIEAGKILGVGEATVSRIKTAFDLVKAEAWEELSERVAISGLSNQLLNWAADRTGKVLPDCVREAERNIWKKKVEAANKDNPTVLVKADPAPVDDNTARMLVNMLTALDTLHRDFEALAGKLGNLTGKLCNIENIIAAEHDKDRELLNTCTDVIADELRTEREC